MRCYACNKLIDEGYDQKTDRWYCSDCFEPTNQILLNILDKEMEELFGKDAVPGAQDWYDMTKDDSFEEMSTNEEEDD